ncbi:MAG: pseudouridine synthase [bacterium]
MSQTDEPPLQVLFHDEHYIAVDKPPDLLVHRSVLSRDRVFLLQRLRDQIGQHVYPIHRLDRATSGVIVFGLNGEAANRLAEQFTAREVSKIYHAVVRGWMPEHEMRLDHPLQDPETGKPFQEAVTGFRELSRVELPYAVDRYPASRYALVEASPETGRRHQIRKHLKHLSHPIIGDVRYGKGTHNRFFRDQFGIQRLLLRAMSLGFIHPYTSEDIEIPVPRDDQWSSMLAATGLST